MGNAVKKYKDQQSGKVRTIDGKPIQISANVMNYHAIHMALLILIDFGFLIALLHLLKHQHDPNRQLGELITSGDIVYTPPVYICNIEKSFSSDEKGILLLRICPSRNYDYRNRFFLRIIIFYYQQILTIMLM